VLNENVKMGSNVVKNGVNRLPQNSKTSGCVYGLFASYILLSQCSGLNLHSSVMTSFLGLD
jgi:hypothetical protein